MNVKLNQVLYLNETGNILYLVNTRIIYQLNHNGINRLMFIKHFKPNISETFKNREVSKVFNNVSTSRCSDKETCNC